MSNNKYQRNKGFDSLKEEKEPTVTFGNCCVCNKTITQGFYGRHGDTGTCSAKCEKAFVKPSLIDNWRKDDLPTL